MFCRKCGKPIPDDSAFCMHCGASLDDATTASKRSAAAPSRSGPHAGTIAGCGIVLFLIVGPISLVYFLVIGGDSRPITTRPAPKPTPYAWVRYDRRGYEASLNGPGNVDPVPLATSAESLDDVSDALDGGRASRTRSLVSSGRAFWVARYTVVKIAGYGIDGGKVKVLVTEGARAGRSGWVEDEWLPVRSR